MYILIKENKHIFLENLSDLLHEYNVKIDDEGNIKLSFGSYYKNQDRIRMKYSLSDENGYTKEEALKDFAKHFLPKILKTNDHYIYKVQEI